MVLIAKWFINALAILGAAYLIPDIKVAGFGTALIVALLLGLMNAVVRPVLILLTLPITAVTLGLFIFVINGALFWALSTFIKGFEVGGLLPAIAGAIVVSVFSWIGNRFIIGDKNSSVFFTRHG